MGIEVDRFSSGGGVLQATQLQEQLSPRDLGDVQKVREAAFERLGDDSVDRPERVFVAIEGEQRARAPQPGQELIQSVRIGELVAEDRLEQFERAGEVPADVMKTTLAQRERKPGGRVEAPAGG